jgi:hypothetical protein
MTYLKHIPRGVAVRAVVRVVVVPAVAALAALGLTACSSASSSSPAASSSSTASSSAGSAASKAGGTTETVSATCELVSAVLSDGPDPDADPVGYAEAQVDPLRRISTQDTKLQNAIGKLASAYQAFYTSNGTKTAGEAVTVASNAINKICPGATS